MLNIWKNGKYSNVIMKTSYSVCTDMILSFPLRIILKPDKNCISRSVFIKSKFYFILLSENYSIKITLNFRETIQLKLILINMLI